MKCRWTCGLLIGYEHAYTSPYYDGRLILPQIAGLERREVLLAAQYLADTHAAGRILRIALTLCSCRSHTSCPGVVARDAEENNLVT